MKDNKKTNKLTNALFIIYLIALFWIIVFKFNIQLPPLRNMRSINLIPFSEPLLLNGKIAFGEIIMNVVIFVPLGIYAEILFKRWITPKVRLQILYLVSRTFSVSTQRTNVSRVSFKINLQENSSIIMYLNNGGEPNLDGGGGSPFSVVSRRLVIKPVNIKICI